MPNTMRKSVVYLVALGVVLVSPLAYAQYKGNQLALKTVYQEGLTIESVHAKESETEINSDVVPTPSLNPAEVSEQEQIEAYIRTIFGSEANVAIAVSRNECGPTRAEYPGCVKNDNVEWSCGLFQVNLRDPKTMRAIHAAKVPGESYEEKCEWLKNPYNNTLIAYKIYQDWNGFNAWTAYTSGRYLKDL